MSIATASDFELAPAPARPSVTPFLLAAASVALADWLFYGRDPMVADLRSGRNVCQNAKQRLENWRAWGFRTWRLQRYLANNPSTSSTPVDGGKG
jgi:hypothetical protein